MNNSSLTSAEKTHIGIFGKRNVGKSSLMNRLTGQDTSTVSSVSGTTTDAVRKAMELPPIGQVVLIDTPGFDDNGDLGERRVKNTLKTITECDVALLALDPFSGIGECENELISLFKKKGVPHISFYTKADLKKMPYALCVSAQTDEGIDDLISELAKFKKEGKRQIIGDLLEKGDTVILVTPIDSAAPSGRLILPQVQTLRDVLDAKCNALVVLPEEYENALASLKTTPKFVITDSQVFGEIERATPKEISLTSFSVLMARLKGTLSYALKGAERISSLNDNDTVLIAEACTHKKQCCDIGTVRLPAWLSEYTKKNLNFSFTSGKDFPDDLSPFKLIIQCGGCMITEREVKARYLLAEEFGVPITNYGTAIAQINGILKRISAPFVE